MKPSLDQDLAEFLGVLLGDGCRSKFVYGGKKIAEAAFTGNPSEMHYYRDFVRPVLMRKFGVRGYLGFRKDNTVRLHIRSKKLAIFLTEMSVPVGKRLDARVPLQISNDSRLLKAFVRRFYHAEGSIYRRYSIRYARHAKVYSNLLVVQFRAKLRTLMRQVIPPSGGSVSRRLGSRKPMACILSASRTNLRSPNSYTSLSPSTS